MMLTFSVSSCNYEYTLSLCQLCLLCVRVPRLQRPHALKPPRATLIHRSLGYSWTIDDRYNSARVPVWDAFMDETAATAGLCFMIAAVSWELPSWVRDNYLIKMLVVTAVIRALIEK